MLTLNWNIIWTFVNIIVLYLLMKKFLFAPVAAIMEARTNKIEGDLKAAKEKNEQAEGLKAEYEKALENAKDAADEIIKDAKVRAQEVDESKLKDAAEEADKIVANANKNIAEEKQRAIHEAQGHIIDLTMVAASKVLEKNVTDDTNKQIVDDFLAEVGAAK